MTVTSGENRILKWTWFGVAIIVGYVIVIMGTSVIWFILPGKGGLNESAMWELLVGNLLIIAVGFLSGTVAEGISKRRNLSCSILISIILLIETFTFVSKGNTNDPLWFIGLEYLILITGIIYGNHYLVKRSQ